MPIPIIPMLYYFSRRHLWLTVKTNQTSDAHRVTPSIYPFKIRVDQNTISTFEKTGYKDIGL